MEVDRRTATVLLVGAIAILALILSAATLTDTTGSEGDTGWVNLGPDENPQGEVFTGTYDIPVIGSYLNSLWTVLVVGAVLVTLYGLLALDRRDFIRLLSVIAVMILLVGALGWLLDHFSQSGINMTSGGPPPNATGGGLETGESPTPGDRGLSVALIGAGLVVALLSVFVIVTQTGDESTDETESGDDEPDAGERLESIGEAAGRATAEMDNDDVVPSNAVYRAWAEMTDVLEVPNRESTTPGEFARAAIEAGMDPEDVTELTRLFEDVRYGEESVSAERTEQARAVLGRIESAYAGEER